MGTTVRWYRGNRGIRCTLYGVNHGIDGGIRSVPCIRGIVGTMSTWYHGNHGVHGIRCTLLTMYTGMVRGVHSYIVYLDNYGT